MYKLRFLAPIGILAVVAGFSAVVMLLWNWLIPTIFGLGTVSFWQALGIFVLCRLLFGGLGRGRHLMHGGMRHGRHHIPEKWLKMTPEERKDFIRKKREHIVKGDFRGLANHVFGTDDDAPKDKD